MKTEQTLVQTTRTEMKNILLDVNTSQFVSFISKTPQKMNDYLDYWLIQENGKKKKNPNPTSNPFQNSGIYSKQYKIDIVIGFNNYEELVINRLRKEGKTEEEVQNFVNRHEIKRTEKITQMRENGKTEEEITEEMNKPQKENWWNVLSNSLCTDKRTESKFYLRYQFTEKSHSKDTEYTHNDNPIERQMFRDYLTKKNTDSYESQGLDKPLNIQMCDLSNIIELTMNGTKYILTD